jgi:zinc/manganese transport system substrate-binding protein
VVYQNHSSQTSNGAIKVVAAENFWGNIVSQIGGSHVSVTSIITDPNTDPHLYESDAQNALAVSQGRLVIENGLGYDDFMDKLMSASTNGSRDLIKVSSVLGISGNDANPHLWYYTAEIPKVTAAIEEELVKIDPNDKATFEANMNTFNQSLQPITDTINTIKLKYPNAPVAYTERVPGYLILAAGLDIKSPSGFAQAIEDGNDPSPADISAMKSLISNHQIKVLLYNAQVTSPTTQHIRDLASQAGIPVVGVTETMPSNEKNFQSWQLDQANALFKALGN